MAAILSGPECFNCGQQPSTFSMMQLYNLYHVVKVTQRMYFRNRHSYTTGREYRRE